MGGFQELEEQRHQVLGSAGSIQKNTSGGQEWPGARQRGAHGGQGPDPQILASGPRVAFHGPGLSGFQLNCQQVSVL